MIQRSLLATLLLALLLTIPAGASTLYESQSLVSVGLGYVILPADVAVVSLAIEHTAKESGLAQRENQRVVSQIVQTLSEEQIPGLEFAVRQASFWESSSLGARERTYKASSGLDIRLTDLDLPGHVIDVATAAGASVQGVRFELSRTGDAAKEALRLAVEDALQKAALMSRAAGMRVVMVREIQDTNAVRVINPSLSTTVGVDAASLTSLAGPIYRGQIAVQAEVTVIFDVALDLSHQR